MTDDTPARVSSRRATSDHVQQGVGSISGRRTRSGGTGPAWSFGEFTIGRPSRRTCSKKAGPITPPSSIDERILSALANSDRPMPIAELRTVCRVRNATLRERLIAMTRAGQLLRDDQGYRLANTNSALTAGIS